MFSPPRPPAFLFPYSTAPDFKGFVVPVGAAAAEVVGVPAADDSAFLTRGHSLRRRVSLEGVTVQNLEGPVRAGCVGGRLRSSLVYQSRTPYIAA